MYLHFDGKLTGNHLLAMALAKQFYGYFTQLYYAPERPSQLPAYVQYVKSGQSNAGYHALSAFGGLYLPEGVFPIREWEPLTLLSLADLPPAIACMKNAYHVGIEKMPLFAQKDSKFVLALLLQAQQGKAMQATKREAKQHGVELIAPNKLCQLDDWHKREKVDCWKQYGHAFFVSLGGYTSLPLHRDSKGQQLIAWLMADVLTDANLLIGA